MTGRFFGESDDLVGKYARFLWNADEHAWPVGGLKPNDFGLFDTYGNVGEWCQNGAAPHPERAAGQASDDVEDLTVVTDQVGLWRGGHFVLGTREMLSGARNRYPPGGRTGAVGLRVARTIR